MRLGCAREGPRPVLCMHSRLPSWLQWPHVALLVLLGVGKTIGWHHQQYGSPPFPSLQHRHTHILPHFTRFQEDFSINFPKQGPPWAAPLCQDSNRDHPSPPQSSSAPSLIYGPNPCPPDPM